MLELVDLQRVRRFFELLAEIDELSITKFCGAFEFTIPLRAVGLFVYNPK